MAKCTFQKGGPSGTIQTYDGLCVLPVNIFNEKIYLFMWFWFVFLLTVTLLGLVYRLITLVFVGARAAALRARTNLLLDSGACARVARNLRLNDWFFICLLGSNLDGHVFSQIINQLDKLFLARSAPNLNGGLNTLPRAPGSSTGESNNSNSTEKVEKIA